MRRVATGWEPQLTIAVDSVIARDPLLDLAGAFYALEPPTRLKLRDETLLGTVEALTRGEADLAIGSVLDAERLAFTASGIRSRPLGSLAFVYAVAPHHPLAREREPLADEVLRRHRAVAAADSSRGGPSMTLRLVGGQDVLTVPTMQSKLAAQLHGLGGGFLPEPMARPWIEAGHLVAAPDRAHTAPRPVARGLARDVRQPTGQGTAMVAGPVRQRDHAARAARAPSRPPGIRWLIACACRCDANRGAAQAVALSGMDL